METLHQFPRLDMVDAAITNLVSMHCPEKKDVPVILGETEPTTRKRREEMKILWIDAPGDMEQIIPGPPWVAPLIARMRCADRTDAPFRVPPDLLALMAEGSGYMLVPIHQAIQLQSLTNLNVSLNLQSSPNNSSQK